MSRESMEIATGKDLIASPMFWIFGVAGSIVATIIGLVILLVNSALQSNEKICGWRNLRHLYNFPLHWVFQSDRTYFLQSGRIFRASWALYCVVIFATYKATITSNAATVHDEPVLETLEDLLEHPEYSIGVSQPDSFFMNNFQIASQDSARHKTYKRLLELNESDPMTLYPDLPYHINRVLEGKYVFLGAVMEKIVMAFVVGDPIDIRINTIDNDQFYMTAPKNAFYKKELEIELQNLVETGILEKLFNRHYYQKETGDTVAHIEVVVHLKSLLYLMQIMGIGVLLATFTLVTEILLAVLQNIISYITHTKRFSIKQYQRKV